MADGDYWYEEGTYAYKAGIGLVELDQHFPTHEMTAVEWQSLQSGWVAEKNDFFESMGQGRLDFS